MEAESVIYNSPSKSRVHRSLRGAATEQGMTLALALPVELVLETVGLFIHSFIRHLWSHYIAAGTAASPENTWH